ncbi:MAG TPA: excinuclease ABC subunit UvrC [Candidatus Saccharimonadaceae bacterium]|jgi:excinuclease ABC subunit C|nr:excinuclease ABC subunit UvrC [Candidatus Saccharimonadaceae bacterium]
MSTLAEKVHNLPALPGVYLFKDPAGEVLYVGKAKSLAQRVRSYLAADNPNPRVPDMMARATDLDTILVETEAEALLLESTLIRQHHPHFNVLLKDDKSFPYVKLSMQDEFPRLSVTRRVLNDGGRYLGPFTDVRNLRRMLREIRRIFPVRTCRNFEDYRRANRPCLYFHIRRCVGPCTTRSRVTPAEYASIVDGLIQFLSGRDADLLARLEREMGEAAEARRYEEAARRRDQIALLSQMRRPQTVVSPLRGAETDVLGLARHGGRAAVAVLMVRGGRVVGKETRWLERTSGLGDAALVETFLGQHYLGAALVPRRILLGVEPESVEGVSEALTRHAAHPVELLVAQRGKGRRLVETAERNAALALEDLEARASGRRSRFSPETLELQKTLGLEAPPWRVVCFDVSNLGADDAVAAIVASENGRPRRGLYRRMRLRRPGPDDFAMIGEAVERYWTRVESGEIPRPDLVLIDGGAGQLGAARAALDRVATRSVAMIGLAKREETVIRERGAPLVLPRRSPALRALQRVRDEAHRFGLTYHRKLRGRRRVVSALDAVAGVGASRRAALLKAFGSVGALREATPEEIAARAHVPASVAARVAEYLAAEREARRAGGER